MIRKKFKTITSLERRDIVEGETIEQKIRRIVNNKEPIKDGAPIIYMERKEGINPAYNIRTDRFEVAMDAMDKIAATKIAQREKRMNPESDKNLEKPSTESIQDTKTGS